MNSHSGSPNTINNKFDNDRSSNDKSSNDRFDGRDLGRLIKYGILMIIISSFIFSPNILYMLSLIMKSVFMIISMLFRSIFLDFGGWGDSDPELSNKMKLDSISSNKLGKIGLDHTTIIGKILRGLIGP